METSRAGLAAAIAARLERDAEALTQRWEAAHPFRYVAIDDLLPTDYADRLAARFPSPGQMMLRSSLRERKRVGVAVEDYDPTVADALFAFQDPRVVTAVNKITGHADAVADPTLYASGISVMAQGDFLNPHIDNSHDGDRRHYRVLNLLYYVSRDWSLAHGGNLELWDVDVRHRVTVESRFNRLVLMETHQTSWHSVERVRAAAVRRCVSNYYFAPRPIRGTSYNHVTTFTGRPEEPLKRLLLDVTDGVVLNALGRTFPQLTMRSKHRIRPAAPR